MSFFPHKKPTYSGVVLLPQANTKYYKHYSYKHYIYEENDNSFVEKLKDVELERYNLSELKQLAEALKIPNLNKMNKPDLLKFIKLKILV